MCDAAHLPDVTPPRV
jgi:hypothetical protein